MIAAMKLKIKTIQVIVGAANNLGIKLSVLVEFNKIVSGA